MRGVTSISTMSGACTFSIQGGGRGRNFLAGIGWGGGGVEILEIWAVQVNPLFRKRRIKCMKKVCVFLRMDVTILFKPRKLTFFFQIRHIIYLLFFSFFSIKISIKEFLLALPFVFA